MSDKIKRVQSATNLAWIDLEMTGLDCQRDVIIQAALIVTNQDLEPLERFVCDVWQPKSELEKMAPFVREMHTVTGLLGRLEKSNKDVRFTEKLLLERVAGWCAYPAVLCGNSVGQDKRFIERYMPGLDGYLSYRIVDVSSLKVLARLWYGEDAVYKKPETGSHDALFDIEQSILELSHYRQRLMQP